ncbi:MAG: DNA-protecting protein DprA [Solirubrobacterales bacterium]|nr:DNA-protecting protein DprA [Solirubrobacterales bacterium]
MSGWVLAPGADGYPAQLADLGELAAPTLYGVGSREAVAGLRADAAVTIVGTRRATAYGLGVAERLAADLALAGVTIVSGMAIGIDAAAHRGALAGSGRTIAVLAGGPDIVYPARHRGLYRELVESGAAVSESEPGTRPLKQDFAIRNRLMAALSKVVVVVEAARPSGSLITAHRAQDLNRELAAVPGHVGVRVAEGTNYLIRECHAHLVRNAQDVLDLLAGVGAVRVTRTGPALEPELDRLLEAVERGAGTPDELARTAGLDAATTAVGLARLELCRYVVSDALGSYSPSGLERPG